MQNLAAGTREAFRPQSALLDLMMPGRDGYEARRRTKTEHADECAARFDGFAACSRTFADKPADLPLAALR